MAKASKKATAKPKKKGKYDTTFKPPEGMTFEDLLKKASTTPLKSKGKKK